LTAIATAKIVVSMKIIVFTTREIAFPLFVIANATLAIAFAITLIAKAIKVKEIDENAVNI